MTSPSPEPEIRAAHHDLGDSSTVEQRIPSVWGIRKDFPKEIAHKLGLDGQVGLGETERRGVRGHFEFGTWAGEPAILWCLQGITNG